MHGVPKVHVGEEMFTVLSDLFLSSLLEIVKIAYRQALLCYPNADVDEKILENFPNTDCYMQGSGSNNL